MTATTEPTTPTTSTDRPEPGPPSAWAARVSGAGALLFAATVVAASAVEGGTRPAHDAAAGEILDFVTDDAWATSLAALLYVLGAIGIFPYLATMWHRCRTTSPVAVRAGVLGFTGVAAFFGAQLSTQVALAAGADELSTSPEVVHALWALGGAFFSFNHLFLAVALAGLGLAAAQNGLAPRWLGPASVVGGVLLLVPPAGAVPNTETGDLMAVGGIGFLIWIVLLVVTGVNLLRSR